MFVLTFEPITLNSLWASETVCGHLKQIKIYFNFSIINVLLVLKPKFLVL